MTKSSMLKKSDEIAVNNVQPNGQIWMAAEQFCNAADLIMDSAGGGIDKFVLPVIMNYAFSAELSLKASEAAVLVKPPSSDGLIPAAQTVSTVTGHNLDKVFSALQPDTRDSISAEFHSITGNDIYELLKRNADCFIKVRYQYEQTGGAYRLSELRTLARGLLDAVKAYGLKVSSQPPRSAVIKRPKKNERNAHHG